MKTIGHLSGCGVAFTLANLIREYTSNNSKCGPVLVLVPDSSLATKLENELSFFLHNTNYEPSLPFLNFPDSETLPYDTFSPHQDIISERLSTLYHLPHLERGLLVLPISTLMHRLCPKDIEFKIPFF